MKRVTATGRTVEDAVTSALVRLGATRSQATIRVIHEPVRGLFGLIGGKEAEVEVSIALTPEETAKDFLTALLKKMGIEGAAVKTRTEKLDDKPAVVLEVSCDEEALSAIIGRHGSTLDSLQYLVNVVVNKEQENFTKFLVDAGDYRNRRREGLEKMAARAAERAVRSRRPVALDPMPAPDRKVVHTFLQSREDVSTTSEGVDPNRKVVVIPAVQSGAGTVSRLRPRSTSRGSNDRYSARVRRD